MTPKKRAEGARPRRRPLAGAALGLCSATGLALSLLLLAGNASLPLTGSADMPGASPSGPHATLAQGVDGDGASATRSNETGMPASEGTANATSSESSSLDEGASGNGASSSDGEAPDASNVAASAGGSNSTANASRSGSAAASEGTADTAGGQSGSPSASSTPSTSAGSPGSSNSSNPSPSPAPTSIAVSLVVDSSAAASLGFPATMAEDALELPEGATAYDALAATGLSLEGSSSYVSAINGLAEKMMGGTSGWTYTVNGAMPMTAASNYVLHEGDAVRWIYVS